MVCPPAPIGTALSAVPVSARSPVFGATARMARAIAAHASVPIWAFVLPRMTGIPHFSEKSSQSFHERRLAIARTAADILNAPMLILSSRLSNSSRTRSSPQMSPRANASRWRTSTSGSSARSALYLSWCGPFAFDAVAVWILSDGRVISLRGREPAPSAILVGKVPA